MHSFSKLQIYTCACIDQARYRAVLYRSKATFFQYAVLPCVYVRVHVNVDASSKYSHPLVARG